MTSLVSKCAPRQLIGQTTSIAPSPHVEQQTTPDVFLVPAASIPMVLLDLSLIKGFAARGPLQLNSTPNDLVHRLSANAPHCSYHPPHTANLYFSLAALLTETWEALA